MMSTEEGRLRARWDSISSVVAAGGSALLARLGWYRRRSPVAFTADASASGQMLGDGPPATQNGLGLPARLLLLTAAFVMLAEVLIFLPSIANFRMNWLTDRLTAARLASLAADAAPDHDVPSMLRLELLSTAKVRSVAIKKNDMRRLVLPPDEPLTVEQSYDLRHQYDPSMAQRVANWTGMIVDALGVLFGGGDRTILVFGHPYAPPGSTFSMTDFVEIVLQESPLRQAMLAFALNILGLSIIISIIAAALVYFALSRLLVHPMMRISRSMVAFSRDPQNASLIITPSRRTDEVGTTERELEHMQQELRSLLNQKSHLAQLGLAVSKINHDLRNLLAGAQLLSDRLAMFKEPAIQSFAPKLIATLDRAINFCNDTLRYGRAEEAAPRRTLFRLADLVVEVGEGLGLPATGICLRSRHCRQRADRCRPRPTLSRHEQSGAQLRPGARAHTGRRGGPRGRERDERGPAGSGDPCQRLARRAADTVRDLRQWPRASRQGSRQSFSGVSRQRSQRWIWPGLDHCRGTGRRAWRTPGALAARDWRRIPDGDSRPHDRRLKTATARWNS